MKKNAVVLSSFCVLHMVKACQCECNNSYVLSYSHEGIGNCSLAGVFRICADCSESAVFKSKLLILMLYQ